MKEWSYNLPSTMYDLPFLCKRKLNEVHRKLHYCQVHTSKAKLKLKLKLGTLRYYLTLSRFQIDDLRITWNKEITFKSSYCYERNNQCFIPRQVPKPGINGWRVSGWYPISLKVWVEPNWRDLATLPTKLEHLNDNIKR